MQPGKLRNADLLPEGGTNRMFDALSFRRALSAFPTGVTVVTTSAGDGSPRGVTVSSFNSVSLEPPLVLWSQHVKAASHPDFSTAGTFTVNVLATHQADISDRFGRPGDEKFAKTAWYYAETGAVIIEGCSAWFECVRVQNIEGGDHTIYMGRVTRASVSGKAPLLFAGRRYLAAQTLPQVAGAVEVEPLPTHVQQVMDELATLTQWGVSLSRLVGEVHVVVGTDSQEVYFTRHLHPGMPLPLEDTSGGLAFLAFGKAQENVKRSVDSAALIADAASRGAVHLTRNLVPGLNLFDMEALSVPIYDRANIMLYALTIFRESPAALETTEETRYIEMTKDRARQIEAYLESRVTLQV